MRAVLRTVLALGFATLFSATALADKRVALIVANGAYKGAALENPTVDAGLVATSLMNIGFSVRVVRDADLAGFDAALSSFGEEAKGADIALFYFAGHGFAVNDGLKPQSVLMSTSADVTASSERILRSGGIALDDIARGLAGQADSTLIFIDACRNDPRISRALGGTGRGLSRLDPIRSRSLFIGLSTRLGDTAEDGEAGKGSPFARAFAAHIQAKGVRIDDAFRRLRDAVRTETGGREVPDIVQDDLPDGAIILAKAELPAVAPAPAAVEATPKPVPAAQAAPPEPALRPRPDVLAVVMPNAKPGPAPVTACDRLAASSDDVDAIAPGVEIEKIDIESAVSACRQATSDYAAERRLMFEFGRALEAQKNYSEALDWYRKAAGAGSSSAMEALGWMYRNGNGVGQDDSQAVTWFRRSADLGNFKAIKNLAYWYMYGTGTTQDYAEAFRLYTRAAQAGDRVAMANIGWLYENGKGIDQDYTQAMAWYRKAADVGNSRAMFSISSLYDTGHGVPASSVESAKWLLLAVRKSTDANVNQVLRDAYSLSPASRKEIQKALRARGLYRGSVSGTFDDATIRALKQLSGQ